MPCAVRFGGVVGNIDSPLVATTGAALFASPKSSSFAIGGAEAPPPRTRKTLAGLRSRWTMPDRWALSSASQISIAIFRASGSGRGRLRFERRAAARRGRPAQRLPFEILEHEEVDAVLMPDVVQRADVRMIERRDRARLALEALAQLRIRRERRRQDLDRHRAIEPRIARPIDLAHATRADERDDFIGAEVHAG